MNAVMTALPLLLVALYLVLLVFTVRTVGGAVAAARGVSEYLGGRLWSVVAFLTLPASLALYLVALLAGRLRASPAVVAAILSWGGRLLLAALTAVSAYQAVNVLAPWPAGRLVMAAYLVSLPLLFAAADLMARRLAQTQPDSRTWLRALMAVSWVIGLLTVAYLEVFHRRGIRRAGWMDALALAALAVALVVGLESALPLTRPGPVVTTSAPPATVPPLPTAP